MQLFSISYQTIDPNGHGILSVFIYPAKNEEMAKIKGDREFSRITKKMYDCNLDEVEIIQVSVDKLNYGLFAQHPWKVRR